MSRDRRVRQLTPSETRLGYDAWAASYDEAGNPMVAASEWALDRAPLACAGLDVVELGCGTGRHVARVLACGARSYTGVDPSRGMLERARARLADPRVRFVEGDAAAIAPASCDLVLVVLVLEHVSDLAATIGAVARALRPGGELRLVEIHPGLVESGTVAHFAEGGDEVRFASVAHAIPDLRDALAAAGFAITSLTEHAATGELLDAVPRLGKHRDRPVLVDVTARL
jgi:malonyl-CoA O-methyltransferase